MFLFRTGLCTRDRFSLSLGRCWNRRGLEGLEPSDSSSCYMRTEISPEPFKSTLCTQPHLSRVFLPIGLHLCPSLALVHVLPLTQNALLPDSLHPPEPGTLKSTSSRKPFLMVLPTQSSPLSKRKDTHRECQWGPSLQPVRIIVGGWCQ